MNILTKIGQIIQYEIRGRWGNEAVSFSFGAYFLIGIVLVGILIFLAVKYFLIRHSYRCLNSKIFKRNDEVRRALEEARDAEKRVNEKLGATKTEKDEALRLRQEAEQKVRILNQELQIARAEKEKVDLSTDYVKTKELYNKLKQELNLLEENLEDISFGVYKPHYDFGTSDLYRKALEQIYEQKKKIIREKRAVLTKVQWTINANKREGQRMTNHYSKLMMRAFNGESDSAIAKVRWNNVTRMEERIHRAFEAINKLGDTVQIQISEEYKNLWLQELQLTYEYQEKLHQEKERERKRREELRDAEKAQEEFEAAKKEAENDESRYGKALAEAKASMEKAKGQEVQELNNKIKLLEEKLVEVHKQKERAISRAQFTKSGYVYIISNIGSFGEKIFKIGMTRRLDPYERIKELGDASVPFDFDVHAMIYSENAPELESSLHFHFEKKKINLANSRSEFFDIVLDEIERFCEQKNIKLELIKLAEAREYRETLALREKVALLQSQTAK